MRLSGKFDVREFLKRVRRSIDGNYSYRKLLVALIVCGGVLLYLGPSIAQWLFSDRGVPAEDYEDRCISDRLAEFQAEAAEYNAHIIRDHPNQETDRKYLPYVGNGVFGLPLSGDISLYLRSKRTLSLRLPFQPLVTYSVDEGSLFREAIVTRYTTGTVRRFQCFRNGHYMDHRYYAHRTMDGIFVQDIKVTNPTAYSQELPLKSQSSVHWLDSSTQNVKILVEGTPNHEYTVVTGHLPTPDSDKIVSIAVVYRLPPRNVVVKAHASTNFQFLTSISYSDPIDKNAYSSEKQNSVKKAVEALKLAISKQQIGLKEEHVSVWTSFWRSGLRISDSKAVGAINGHKINSTMYYVLSQVPKGQPDYERSVKRSEGCYRGHHTLDAPRLWESTESIEGVNEIVAAWMVTLEKQGCHNLMTGGPGAVQQAILLSLGGFRFTNQHLEFYIHPRYLHRDYLFRRIGYGNITTFNVSVVVDENNRAVLSVALDKSDAVYYGCDAGCLDAPIPLGQSYTSFPVKLTEPFTAILYISSDHQHMQDLKSALHVHEVDEAPAHDHQVMALHKHGHQLGGLPTFFWVSICFLIVIFHLFLCKLILNEYCDTQDRQRGRYSKP